MIQFEMRCSKLMFVLLSLLIVSIGNARADSIVGTFTLSTGEVRDYSSYQSKILIVDATASWCTSCDAQLRQLQDVYDAVDESVVILTLSIDTGDKLSNIIELKSRFSSPWLFGLDQDGDFLDSYQVEWLPTLHIFDENGILRKRWVGTVQASLIVDSLNEIAEANEKQASYSLESEKEERENLILRQNIKNLFSTETLLFIPIIVIFAVYTKISIRSEKSKESELS